MKKSLKQKDTFIGSIKDSLSFNLNSGFGKGIGCGAIVSLIWIIIILVFLFYTFFFKKWSYTTYNTSGGSYEDELPQDLTNDDYNAMYPFSRNNGGIVGVRQFPYIVIDGERIYIGELK